VDPVAVVQQLLHLDIGVDDGDYFFCHLDACDDTIFFYKKLHRTLMAFVNAGEGGVVTVTDILQNALSDNFFPCHTLFSFRGSFKTEHFLILCAENQHVAHDDVVVDVFAEG